jgi:putative two-component system response regulator
MRQYPGVAYLQIARDIALTHHERLDGSGYPKGLTGQDTPWCGRIVALADVYDALTSKRVYKSAFTHDVARSMILNDSGKHFDPAVVDAFVAREEQFLAIRETYSEAELVAV